LAEAETTGRLSTLLQHRVVRFAQERQGRFVLELEQLDLRGRVVARRTLRCRALVLAAGFYGTTSLLLKAQTEGTVPGLPESLGEGVGDNGLVMFVRRGFGDDTGKAQAGPPVFSAQGPAHVRGANTSGLDSGLDSALAPAPCSVEVAPLPYVSFGHALLQAVITHHGARGVLRHDERTGQTRFDYDEANLDVPRRTGASMAQLFNDAAGGQLSTMPPFRGMLQGEVAHGTGGCVLGQTCDAFGRVMGVPGLYVVDGALLPGTGAGANPALTITALAERCFDRIVNEDGKFLGATT
jgi:cholesterol oxidase